IIRIPLEEEKTGKTRNLPMTEGARRILREVPANLTHPFVFSGPNNEPVTKNQLQWHFKKACRAAGIEDCTPHTLRHTVGSWMAQRGVSLYKVGKWLGHSNSRTTERYAHLTPDHLADAKAALEQTVPKPVPPALKENRG
ncbi:MAG: site-specific integrase, partial [Nitrospinota bacterium]